MFGASGVNNIYRWALVKNPDGDEILANLSDSGGTFHNPGLNPTTREFNKYCLAKGISYSDGSRAISALKVYVSKAAMARCGPMRADDTLTFHIAKDGGGTASILHGMGDLYFKANA